MIDQTELNFLVCNILNAKRFSNCRLCLKEIKNHYVRFDDMVCLDNTAVTAVFTPLTDILKKLLGEDISDELPGIEAVCPNCVENVFQAVRFLEKSRRSTEILNEVFNNLNSTISNEIYVKNNQSLYIVIENSETKAIVVNNERNKNIDAGDDCEFECSKCNVYFANYLDLKAHNLTIHGTYTCEKCLDVFITDTELEIHNEKNHKLECPVCSQNWSSEETLRQHQDRAHNLHVCKDCGKSYKGLDKLHLHEAKHSGQNICPKCGKKYTTKEFYAKHVELCIKDMIDPHPMRSNYSRSYSCSKCDKSYSTPGGLRVHNRFSHENAKPHVCEHCGKKFTAPSYLKIHMIKHTGEKNYKCELCKSRFVSKEALLYHTRRHTGEKPINCNICNEKFVNASARAEHIKFRHVGPTLMCEICSRKFVTSHFLKQHISRHHDKSSKLYYGRNMIPPNMPGEQNMRLRANIEK